ncbi:DUF2637 domain-containing protein [Streptomyces stelliscabiei]|uniref:DUF2637 domain-containing protein n=1 Tax=Streptomyces stelliscabiei TaxID=146820 RepID=UPI002FF16540
MAEQHPSAPALPSDTQPRAIIALAITAAALIFLLTGVSLWLSYEHLHDVGARHGFADDPIRAWAWPATLDLFYAAGEVLILRAALARRIDWWAISLVVFGAGGSIALNIAGVGENAHVLDYVVAAVPPVASLLAFGALMNQLYRLLAQRAEAAAPVVAAAAEETDDEEEWVTAPVMPPAPPVMPPAPPAPLPAPAPAPIQYSDPRCAVIRPLYDAGTRPGTKAMRTAIIAAGYSDLSDGVIRGQLRAEVEKHEPGLAALPPAPVAFTA